MCKFLASHVLRQDKTMPFVPGRLDLGSPGVQTSMSRTTPLAMCGNYSCVDGVVVGASDSELWAALGTVWKTTQNIIYIDNIHSIYIHNIYIYIFIIYD